MKVHFIGIGGIGISGLARYYVDQGFEVSGTNDLESPETLRDLQEMGVKVYFDLNVTNIDPKTDLIVYSNAWPKNFPDFMDQIHTLGISVKSYPEALGEITTKYNTICVAGTHGKTTTTAMILHILSDVGLEPTGIVGSLLSETGSNYIKGDGNILVIEADEYAKAFMNYSPSTVVVTNIDHDHHDIYPTLTDLQETFRKLGEKLPVVGKLVCSALDQNSWDTFEDLEREIIDYSNIDINDLNLKVPGQFNRRNAQAAIAGVRVLGVDEDRAKKSLATFKGTWRRQEYKGETATGQFVYDDYAHHPTEIQASLAGFRELFPDKKIAVIFQPHLYSRTRELFQEFCQSFDQKAVDQVVIAPVYAAREVVDESVDSNKLAECISRNHRNVVAVTNMESSIDFIDKEMDIIITMGAGSITELGKQLVKGAK